MGETQEVDGAVTPTPRKPFGVTFNTPRNLPQQACRTQSHIGWENFLKDRISREWLTYVRCNETHSNVTERARNGRRNLLGTMGTFEMFVAISERHLPPDNDGTIAQYKLKALDR
jgi:hypothetical protein